MANGDPFDPRHTQIGKIKGVNYLGNNRQNNIFPTQDEQAGTPHGSRRKRVDTAPDDPCAGLSALERKKAGCP
jgi:hypothetical protein